MEYIQYRLWHATWSCPLPHLVNSEHTAAVCEIVTVEIKLTQQTVNVLVRESTTTVERHDRLVSLVVLPGERGERWKTTLFETYLTPFG